MTETYFRDGHAIHAPVGSFGANAFGLFDMHGNVWEWCRDGYEEKLPGGVNPEVTKATYRVVRGGSWPFPSASSRSASRFRFEPGFRYNSGLGFRVAAVPSASQVK